jgi:hypothetical protein
MIQEPAMTESGIKDLKKKIANPQLCERIVQFVAHPETELPSAGRFASSSIINIINNNIIIIVVVVAAAAACG